MALGIEEFSRAVSHIAVSSSQPDRWAATFDDLTHQLGATACTLIFGSGLDHEIVSTTIGPEAATAYAAHFHQFDFVMDACVRAPIGLVQSGWDLVAANRRTAFHADWQRRFEMADGLHVRLASPTAAPASFLVSAAPRSEPFATTERVRFLDALVPHLQHALTTRHHLLNAQQDPDHLDSADDVTGHGLIVVAAGGRIARMNTAARNVIASGEGLRIRRGIIEAHSPAVEDGLRAAVARALTGQPHRVRCGSDLICPRPSGRRPYVLRVMPLDTYDDPRLARAAILVIDPERERTPPTALLHLLFGLTTTETEVALRLLDGDGLKAIADASGSSLATVKTHVQHVFGKTGTHRQAELIRLLLTLTP